MNTLLQNLARLQAIEFKEVTEKDAQTVIAELRGKIPPQIIGHYDRLVAKGKKGVTAVRGQTCTGCHMQVPLAVVMTLKHGTDIQLCENCGRYLYLLDTAQVEAAPPAVSPKRVRKARVPKKDLHPV